MNWDDNIVVPAIFSIQFAMLSENAIIIEAEFWSCLLPGIQWNPSTPDTIGTAVSVLISGVSLFQGLICTHLYVFVAKPSVRISGVSGFQGCPE